MLELSKSSASVKQPPPKKKNMTGYVNKESMLGYHANPICLIKYGFLKERDYFWTNMLCYIYSFWGISFSTFWIFPFSLRKAVICLPLLVDAVIVLVNLHYVIV